MKRGVSFLESIQGGSLSTSPAMGVHKEIGSHCNNRVSGVLSIENSSCSKSHGGGAVNMTMIAREIQYEKLETILMYVDVVGLGLIAICTMYEGYQTWNELYVFNFQVNLFPLAAWYAGRCAQAFALVVLIFHVLGKNEGMLEAGGMYLLTIGPIINAISAFYFRPVNDPFHSFKRNSGWIAVEMTELFGIILLDISCLEVPKLYQMHILIVELVGYYVVALAALFEYDFGEGPNIFEQNAVSFYASQYFISMLQLFPGWSNLVNIRVVFTFWRVLDAFGLLLLAIVACWGYRIENERHAEEVENKKHKRSLSNKCEYIDCESNLLHDV